MTDFAMPSLSSHQPDIVLRAFPVQLISCGEDTVIKRGIVEVKIAGAGSFSVLQQLFSRVPADGISRIALYESFDVSERNEVNALIEHLLTRRILTHDLTDKSVEGTESPLDVYYWHFGATASSVNQRLNSRRMLIVGVNRISLQLQTALQQQRPTPLTMLDFPPLRGSDDSEVDHTLGTVQILNSLTDIETSDYHCIVAASENGQYRPLREINQLCAVRSVDFMPILQKDLTGYIGPHYIALQSPCFECLLYRRDSNTADLLTTQCVRDYECPDFLATAVHPSLSRILGEMAACELARSYGVGWPWRRIGRVIEFKMPAASMKVRRVLRVPYCGVCGRHRCEAEVADAR